MARFRGGKKSPSGKRNVLYTRVKGRQNAKRKPLLPSRGITQTSYETGFFDFLNIFWNNNRGMEICSLTKQVANAWDTLLPKPKLSKRRVLKDYSKEFELLQQEAKKRKIEEEKHERIKRKERERKKYESEENSGSETELSSRSNFDNSEESITSKGDMDDDRSRSDVDEKESQTDDESISENKSKSQEDSESEYESDDKQDMSRRRVKRKRKGRRYDSFEAYVNARGKMSKTQTNDAKRSDGNGNDEGNSEENKNSGSDQNNQEVESQKEDIFFPIREITSFERIVRTDFEDQNEMLRKLKLHGSNTSPDVPDNDETKGIQSDESFSSPLAGPKISSHSRDSIPTIAKLTSPTDTLHVKNLVVGIRQPELQDIFKIFLNDIILIRVLDNKLNGEAVVEFKTVEAAENVWRQMNGVEYKRLPLVLEFANKEDLIY